MLGSLPELRYTSGLLRSHQLWEAGYLCADIVYQWRVLPYPWRKSSGRNHQHAVKLDEATGQH